jgi:hypothetical protein
VTKEEKWWSAPSTNNICHYTTAEALMSILNEERLRLGPFRHSNDPYEFESWIPSAIMGDGPRDNADMTLSRLITMHSRINRVAFATDDNEGPPSYVGHDVGHRGFGSLPMWAHYGDRFRGACLVFDKQKLVQSVLEELQASSDAIYHRAVFYCEDVPYVPSIGINDDVAAYIRAHEGDLLFRKRKQWSYEREFRIVTVSRSECPQSVQYGDALRGVITGARGLLNHWRLAEVYGIRAQGQMLSNGLQTIY